MQYPHIVTVMIRSVVEWKASCGSSRLSKTADSDTTDSDATRCDSPEKVIEHTIYHTQMHRYYQSGEYQNILELG